MKKVLVALAVMVCFVGTAFAGEVVTKTPVVKPKVEKKEKSKFKNTSTVKKVKKVKK